MDIFLKKENTKIDSNNLKLFCIEKIRKQETQENKYEGIDKNFCKNEKDFKSKKKTKRLGKFRKYDVDSMKKLLKKNLWNNVHKNVSNYATISHVKSKDKQFKVKTLKKFEVELLKKTIGMIYKEYYDLDDEDFKKKLVNERVYNKLRLILDKSLEDFFQEYRNSIDFFLDAVVSSKYDCHKLLKYLNLGKCYLTYLKNRKHTNISNTPDDPGLSDLFYENYEKYIKDNINLDGKTLFPNIQLGRKRSKKLNNCKKYSKSIITSNDITILGTEITASENVNTEEEYKNKLHTLLSEMYKNLNNESFQKILKNSLNEYLQNNHISSASLDLSFAKLTNQPESKTSSFTNNLSTSIFNYGNKSSLFESKPNSFNSVFSARSVNHILYGGKK